MSKAGVIITAVFTGIGVVVSLLSILLPVLFGIAGDIGDLRERVARVETRLEFVEARLENVETGLENVETRLENVETGLEYALPRPLDAAPEQLP